MITIEWDSEDHCYVLTCSVLLPHFREDVFTFFSDAFRLEQITPPWLHFHITTAAPIHLQKGCIKDLRRIFEFRRERMLAMFPVANATSERINS